MRETLEVASSSGATAARVDTDGEDAYIPVVAGNVDAYSKDEAGNVQQHSESKVAEVWLKKVRQCQQLLWVQPQQVVL